ncbi:hypothetical protein [Actinoplanes ianthinogenes]|nr:hypothetical protein [Actinoplanes ianthinogenes]
MELLEQVPWEPYSGPTRAAQLPRAVKVAAGTTVRLGEAVTIGSLKFTATRLADDQVDPEPMNWYPEPAKGNRLVGYLLDIQNVGTTPYVGEPSDFGWLSDSRGHWLDPLDAEGWPIALRLNPGWSGQREFAFEVSASRKLTRLRLTLRPGVASQTVEWKLS